MTLPEFKTIVDAAKREIKEIDVAELKRMQQSGDSFTLIDVRERDEQSRGTIPGAIPIPRGIIERDIHQATTDKEKPIVLYCGGGSRSALAAHSLKQMGFRNVMSLIGGHGAWDKGK